ncbi:hypothetical protein OXYTRIMIC_392 [Oxytricha trifallax]|uniref:Uncharacterized protein n=1 Tax=Oxytricha trifallax TaxID=1172189 RepID=A0A073I0S8_9SPIT|nr:hypothetical protein OXYTRIMIC_392 [Oxytricha trifallax]
MRENALLHILHSSHRFLNPQIFHIKGKLNQQYNYCIYRLVVFFYVVNEFKNRFQTLIGCSPYLIQQLLKSQRVLEEMIPKRLLSSFQSLMLKETFQLNVKKVLGEEDEQHLQKSVKLVESIFKILDLKLDVTNQ